MLIPCPKCQHSSVDIYKDTSPGSRSWPYNAVVHCRICAHRLFGSVAVQYTETQVALLEAAEAKVRAAEQRRKAELRRATVEEEARTSRKRERDRLYRQRKRAALRVVESVPSCAYSECSLPKRPNSKYCSRVCSNKNARDNFKKRQMAS
jgi:hypothetical protein